VVVMAVMERVCYATYTYQSISPLGHAYQWAHRDREQPHLAQSLAAVVALG